MSRESEQLVIRVEPILFDHAKLAEEQAQRNQLLRDWANRSPAQKVVDLVCGRKLHLPQITVETPNNILADKLFGSDVFISIKCPDCQMGWTEPRLEHCSFGEEIVRVFGFCPCCFTQVEADISFCLS
jgi:hypothetical protein